MYQALNMLKKAIEIILKYRALTLFTFILKFHILIVLEVRHPLLMPHIGVLIMQKKTFCNYYFKSFLTDICNPCRLLITHNFTSLVSRFCVHETFQLNQSNFLIFNPVFIRVSFHTNSTKTIPHSVYG